MDLSKYQTLSGITVSSSDQVRVSAIINRTRSILETMLGFTLDPSKVSTNFYNELGKTQIECPCPSVDIDNLLAADDIVDSYRLFPYNKLDKYFHVDPFITLNTMKLVILRDGDEPNGITVKTFESDEIRIESAYNSVSKYIRETVGCFCNTDCGDNVQIAIDASWLFEECLPDDLRYLWVDMIGYYSDCKSNIKSESINTHSYTKFDNVKPEEEKQNLAIIRKYAGPFGSVTRRVV
jgi:hypothetical protein